MKKGHGTMSVLRGWEKTTLTTTESRLVLSSSFSTSKMIALLMDAVPQPLALWGALKFWFFI